MKNLIHGYLTAPDRKKGEVLRLIANILGFSEQDVGKVGMTIVLALLQMVLDLLAWIPVGLE